MGVEFTDNSSQILAELERKRRKILEVIGQKAEGYAKKRIRDQGAVRTSRLMNDITHRVKDDTVEVGTSVVYAPYVELGTGPHFQPPPEWEKFDSPRGSGVGKAYVKPRPFIRPAIEEHADEYQRDAERILSE